MSSSVQSSCSSKQTFSDYATSLLSLKRFEEAKSLLREATPVARRALGKGHRLTLKMRWNYAQTLCRDTSVTLDDLREAVTTLEDTEPIARRVLGSAHPITTGIEHDLRAIRDALHKMLRVRETLSGRP